MSGGLLDIRRVAPRDEERFRQLWRGYRAFYRASDDREVEDVLWRELLADGREIRGYVADAGEGAVGLVTYVFHRSTNNVKPICYLQDLFVDKSQRGGGIAKALMLACIEDAKGSGAFRVYWQTQEYNAAARSLYDTITPRSSFIVYRKEL
jgi:GNAT superfamily N-acetyltransferase